MAQQRPIMALLELMNKKWSMRVLWELHTSASTFRELQSRCGEISPTVLNKRVKELRASLLITDGDAGYELTSLGHELIEQFHPINKWAKKWVKQVGIIDEADH